MPCIVFAFNRPDKLERVLMALKTQDIARLIVFVDGPRDHADVKLVEQCKTIAKNVDWIDAELYFKEKNYGLSGISDNISKVMESYESAIFVEDDCLPMLGFYSFMKQALVHYRMHKKVFAIGGYQPLSRKYFRNYPYSLMSTWRFTCWGWATWKDRWELINPYLLKFSELFDSLSNVPDIAGEDIGKSARAVAEGRLATWDIQVSIAMLWLQKVMLLPTRGLVRNIGFESGVHGHKPTIQIHNLNVNINDTGLPENIVWLEEVEPQSYYVNAIKKNAQQTIHPSIYCRILRKLVKLQHSIIRNFK